MEKDASSAGVDPIGGLFSTADIKVLVCYLLSTISEAVPANELINVLHYEGIANGFEVSDAIVSLIKSGHIVLENEKDDSYVITPAGKEIAKMLHTSLSYVVKNRAYNAAMRMLSRFKNAKATELHVSHENGRTYVNCTATDGIAPFMSVKLQVADDMQASYMEERFLNDPSKVYLGLIDLLTKE